MRKRAVPLIIATGLTFTTAVPPAASALAVSDHAQSAFRTTNDVRDLHGRRELDRQQCLQRRAADQARRMARRERIFHQDLGPVLRRCGLRLAGENVARGYPTGKAVVARGWMRSEGHRRNLLGRAYRLMGLASRRSDDGTLYTAQLLGVR